MWAIEDSLNDLINLTQGKENGRGQYYGHCPHHNDSNASFHFTLKDDKILVHCKSGCDQKDLIESIKLKGIYLSSQREKKSPYEKIWEESVTLLRDSIGAKYLLGRGIKGVGNTLQVRYHPSLAYFSQSQPIGDFPALIFKLETTYGKFCGVQRIYLDPNGKKANVKSPKKVLGETKFAAIKFDTPKEVLHVAEGPETALAVRGQLKTATWSLISSGGMEEFRAPIHIKELHIWADLDKSGAGQKAAEKCALLNSEGDRKIFIHLPTPIEGQKNTDWLDAYNHDNDSIINEYSNTRESEINKDWEFEGGFYKFYSLAKILSNPLPEPKWLVHELLPESGFNIIAGPPKAGKSTIIRQLVTTMNSGGSILERKVNPGNVLYIAYEEDFYDVARQFYTMGAENALNVYIHVGFPEKPDLVQLEDIIRERQIKLVILDTLVNVLGTDKLNDYGIMSPKLNEIVGFSRKNNVCVLGIHHTNKTGEESNAIMGSVAFKASVQTAILMTWNEENDERTVKTIQRTGNSLAKTILQYDFDTNFLTLGTEKRKADENTCIAAILDVVGKNPGITKVELYEKVTGHNNLINRITNKLAEKGKLRFEGKGKPRDPKRFFVRSFSI